MRIAILSPIFEAVPPKGWGGVELVVYNLVESLVKNGHDVTLFCAENYHTHARVITNGLPPANHDPKQKPEVSQEILDEKLIARQDNFDIINAHTSHRFLYLEKKIKIPHLLTIHTIFREQWKLLYREHPKLPIVTVSKAQASLSGLKLNFIRTVYNGINIEEFDYSSKGGKYLAWLGRIVRSKGLLIAINLAKKLKFKLRFAGRFIYDSEDDRIYAREIKKAMKHSLIEWVGEVKGQKKVNFLKNALVLVNPIVWDEPFGLVVPEANACGTPVVAFDRGAMPELIKDDLNGFLINSDNIGQMIQAIKQIYEMPAKKYQAMRRSCRKQVEENFTMEKMVDGYEKVYKEVISDWKKKHG